MHNKAKYILILLLVPYKIFSQSTLENQISGSFETNNIFYLNDSIINAKSPKDKIGSNSYLKLDFRRGDFTAGIQYEAYLPPILGYNPLLQGNGIINRFATYKNDFISITGGTFYEQFGSGLIFRTYEERSLGINTPLDGIAIKFTPHEAIQVKTIWGKQKEQFDVSDAIVRGADVDFLLTQLLLPNSAFILSVGGSWLSKYENYTGPIINYPLTVNSYAGRMQLNYKDYNLYFEYVNKGKDPAFVNLYSFRTGSAYLLNQSFSKNGFGAVLALRRIENADIRSERDELGSGLTLNYLPSLTKQHKYSLANLHPYSTRNRGEIGGQVDLFYRFQKGSAIGGATGLKLAANFSSYYSLDYSANKSTMKIGDTLLFRDMGLEFEKKISNNLKGALSIISQNFNKVSLTGLNSMVITRMVVLDFTYKLSAKNSMRIEVSELLGVKNEDDWTMGVVEMGFIPKWSIFISDMVQHRSQDIHYYKGGISFTQSSTKISFAFGRSKEGLQCVSGMCRYMPAYTGANLSISTSF